MKTKKITPYSRHDISNKDVYNVLKVIKSDFLTTGPEVEKFEKKLIKKFHSKFASCVNSATSALHLACLSLGLKKGDIKWTSAISFVASANCGLYCGASVDFIDIDIDTFNLSIKDLEKKLYLSKLKKKFGFKIIEDASHAIGAKYQNLKIGSCTYSDACIFSFHPVKIITSAEGGVVLTNSSKVYNYVNLLRSHGIDKNKSKEIWFYKQTCLGFNYRLNDMQASLGSSQLNRLDKFLSYRNKVSNYYIENLDKRIKVQKICKGNYSSYHLFIVLVKQKLRDKIFKKLRDKGFFVNLHYIPIYNHNFYRKKLLIDKKKFPNSEIYSKTAISIPNFYNLEFKKIKKVINIINRFYN